MARRASVGGIAGAWPSVVGSRGSPGGGGHECGCAALQALSRARRARNPALRRVIAVDRPTTNGIFGWFRRTQATKLVSDRAAAVVRGLARCRAR